MTERWACADDCTHPHHRRDDAERDLLERVEAAAREYCESANSLGHRDSRKLHRLELALCDLDRLRGAREKPAYFNRAYWESCFPGDKG